jgi:hypothetical protein
MLKEVNEEMLVRFGMSKGAVVITASDVVLGTFGNAELYTIQDEPSSKPSSMPSLKPS